MTESAIYHCPSNSGIPGGATCLGQRLSSQIKDRQRRLCSRYDHAKPSVVLYSKLQFYEKIT